MRPLPARLRDKLTELDVTRASVLVAVSGGSDSVALLYLLNDLASEFRLKLTVGHVNHGLRRGAAGDQAFVLSLARQLGLPFVTTSLKAPQKGIEAAARLARYEFLQREAKKMSGRRKLIAIAHTADDQAETVLLNLLRGSGIRGLAGMRERSGVVARPLLTFRKDELTAHLKKSGIKWREDSSNRNEQFRRNRVRHTLLPLLTEQFQPAIVPILIRLAASMREQVDYIDSLVDPLFVSFKKNSYSMPRTTFLKLPRLLQKELLARTAEEILGDRHELANVHLEHAIAVIISPDSPKIVEFPRFLKLEKARGKLTVGLAARKLPKQR